MEWFATVGPLVDRWWTEVGRDDEAFPDVAERAIRDFPPVAHVDVEAFVRCVLAGDVGHQFAPPGAFGQPGVTAWHGGDFVIDVYLWTSGLSAIHDHPFCGLFTILRGPPEARTPDGLDPRIVRYFRGSILEALLA